MSVPTIGCIGAGFIGGALIRGFNGWTDIKVYDKGKNIGSIEEVCQQDVIFLCLPTPMKKNGDVDTSIVEEVILEVDKKLSERKPVVIRSTVPPTFCETVAAKVNNSEIMFMPEFLTERTADLDFIMSSRFILGCKMKIDPVAFERIPAEEINKVHTLFKTRFPKTRFQVVPWREASLVKYGTNAFFTVKLSFFNELAQICEVLEVEPMDVIGEVLQDGRIGRSHFKVPGHDGDRGWGGSCFAKDNKGYQSFSKNLGINPIMVKAAWDKNDEVRTNRNWEKMKGRAVSE